MASKFRNIPTAISLDNQINYLDGNQRMSMAGRKRSLIPTASFGARHSVFGSKYDSHFRI